MVKKKYSNELSFKGFDFWVLVKNNKDAIKTIVALIGTVSVLGVTVEGAVISIVVKALFDLADFYVSKVDLK